MLIIVLLEITDRTSDQNQAYDVMDRAFIVKLLCHLLYMALAERGLNFILFFNPGSLSKYPLFVLFIKAEMPERPVPKF